MLKKIKKLILISPFVILPSVALSAGCAPSEPFDPNPDKQILVKTKHEVDDVYYDVRYNMAYDNLTDDEKESIISFFENTNQEEFLKLKAIYRDRLIDPPLIEYSYFENECFNLKDKNGRYNKIVIAIKSANIEYTNEQLKRRQVAITNENNHYDVTKHLEYEIFKWNATNEKLGWIKKIPTDIQNKLELNINFSFNLHVVNDTNYSTVFDESKAEAISIPWGDPLVKPNWIDGTIIRWSDGDTLYFKPNLESNETLYKKMEPYFYPQQKDIEKGKIDEELRGSISIRIASIDTPEKAINTSQSNPYEYNYAMLATKFGKNNWPKGTRVRLFTKGSLDSFGRITGNIFVGENYQYSYSTEIVRAGYTVPLRKETNDKDASSPEYYITYPISKALRQAYNEGNGLFKDYKTIEGVTRFVYQQKEPSPHSVKYLWDYSFTDSSYQDLYSWVKKYGYDYVYQAAEIKADVEAHEEANNRNTN